MRGRDGTARARTDDGRGCPSAPLACMDPELRSRAGPACLQQTRVQGGQELPQLGCCRCVVHQQNPGGLVERPRAHASAQRCRQQVLDRRQPPATLLHTRHQPGQRGAAEQCLRHRKAGRRRGMAGGAHPRSLASPVLPSKAGRRLSPGLQVAAATPCRNVALTALTPRTSPKALRRAANSLDQPRRHERPARRPASPTSPSPPHASQDPDPAVRQPQ